MNKKKKNKAIHIAAALLLGIVCLQRVAAQEKLQQQFEAYRENNLQEKLFLHTDKSFYLAGEICWFKIYNVDAFFNRPLDMSKLAYVELIDENNKPVLQAKIPLHQGDGNGSLQLPVSLGSGTYTLRAYTNWMKNFSVDYFFHKALTVINTRMAWLPASTEPQKPYHLDFFPEGGHLVNGLQSKVAFKLSAPNGNGADCEGVVINEKGDTVAKYNSQQFGMGSFFLTPVAGHRYRGMVQLPGGKTIVQDLPLAADNGFVMQLFAENRDQIRIAVQCNATGADNAEVYLFAHTRCSVKSVQKHSFRQGYTEFLVDKNKLGEGISHLTVFNSQRQPVCERLYFTYPQNQLKPAIKIGAAEEGTRKKITVQVTTTDQNGLQVPASMSMAVYRLDSLQGIDEMNIADYLWLGSDLAGPAESPSWYFSGNIDSTAVAMDNLMLTQGWRRFTWDDIVEDKKPLFSFVPENGGHLVTGKISKATSGAAGAGIGAYLSVPGTHTQFRNAVSDKAGHITFEMRDFYNQGGVIVQTDNIQDSAYLVEIQNPFLEKYSHLNWPGFPLTARHSQDLAKRNTAVHVQNEYNGRLLRQFSGPAIDTTPFYFKPDVGYLLDNYVRFTTMEEVLREYVLPVNVRKKNNRFHLPVFDALSKQFFINEPLLLLDGVPVFDLNKLMQYDPLKIRQLEVVSRRYFLGNMFFEGVVNFVSYKGNLDGYELDPQATVIDYDGLQLQRTFYSPVYETAQQLNSRLPDFRTLLYWSASIQTNAAGRQDLSFYSSDISGKYVVVLQGLSADGKPGMATESFEIKAPPAFTSNR